MNFEEDKEKSANSGVNEVEYELPNGEKVKVNAPRFAAPEALFKPNLIDA